MALRIVPEKSRLEGREGVVCLESDSPPQEGYAELTSAEARQMAKEAIIQLGIAMPALNGIARPYAVDLNGEELTPLTQAKNPEFRYRIDYQFYRVF